MSRLAICIAKAGRDYVTFIGPHFVSEGKRAAESLIKNHGGKSKIIQLEGTTRRLIDIAPIAARVSAADGRSADWWALPKRQSAWVSNTPWNGPDIAERYDKF